MEKLLIIIIFLSCALLPNVNVTQSMFKEVGALLVASLFVIYWVWKHNKWLAAFLLWLVIRMMLPPIQPRGMITLTNVFMAAMLYLATQYVKFNWKNIRIALSITLGLQVLAVVCQKLNIFFCWNSMNDGGRVWGLFGNSNWSGAYIAMTIPIAFSLYKQSKWWGMLGTLGVISLLIMHSNFSILAAVISLAFTAFYTNEKFILKHHIDKIILSIIIAATAFVVLNPIYFNDGGRFEMWHRAAKFCVYNPTGDATSGQDPASQSHFIQGRGIGEAYNLLPLIQDKSYTDKWRQAHCEPLQILFEYGLIGLVIASGLVISTLKKTSKANIYLMASLLAIVVNSLGFFPFRTSPIGYIAILLLGAIDKDAILL